MSAPAPGSTPMMMPMMLPRHIGHWYFLVSIHWLARMQPNFRFGSLRRLRRTIARMTSDTAKTPTSAGIGSIPPSRSVRPKVKRGVPAGFSMPMQAISRPSSIEAMALIGEDRATRVAHISPRKASQKYS